jgi:hypothetical protein
MDYPGKGMTFPIEAQQVDKNLLFDIHTVTNRYKKDAIGLLVSRNEVFNLSLYRTCSSSFFNTALSTLHSKGLITLTPFTLALTQAGFDHLYDN